jgi:hypothetical protein
LHQRAPVSDFHSPILRYDSGTALLPDSLRDSATAEALQAIVDLDLEEVLAIIPPRGYGHD